MMDGWMNEEELEKCCRFWVDDDGTAPQAVDGVSE
jgi:hypothetical protein